MYKEYLLTIFNMTTEQTIGAITAMLEENFKNSHDDIFYCTRVQEAWEVWTMTRDDFTPFVETESYSEIIEEVRTLEEELVTSLKKAKEEEKQRIVGILEEMKLWVQEANERNPNFMDEMVYNYSTQILQEAITRISNNQY